MKKLLEQRPWGNFVRYTHNEISTVKIITVEPGQKLSLQYHDHRQEFWRIVQGNPTVTIGDQTMSGKEGDEFFVETKTPHRIAATKDRVVFLEIALGTFDETDIVRIEDDYGRVS
ncbi:MAG: mannose-phosphate guanylyltransferase/mannose-6-phosphate isomerase [Candidatus Taylorbacteria bacterium]|nr:mannose-phosphate guanylyltransferase/mannose-6-phosphate isomerase [Candidatus Taylorbacteria bacterium]